MNLGPTMAADEDSGGGASTVAAGLARSILGALVATKLRIASLAVLGVVGLVVGGFLLGALGVPSVAGLQNDFGDVSQNTTTVESNLTVTNPNPIGVSLGGVTVDYAIDMNDVRMATGTKEGVSIGAGNSTIYLETALNNSAIPAWWASHVANGERTEVSVDATVTSSTLGRSRTFTQTRSIETDLIGQFDSEETRPIEANHALVDDPVLYVNETTASWGRVSDAETPIDMGFTLYNPNVEPYTFSELRYDVSMNGVQLGQGATEDPVVIPGGSTATLDAEAAIRNQHLDDWWVTHLNETPHGHQVSRFRIEFEAVVELPTGDRVTVPLDELTHEQYVGTDVFEEGGDVGVPPDERSGGDAGDDDADGGSGDDTDGGSTDGGSTDGGATDGGSSDDDGVTDGVL